MDQLNPIPMALHAMSDAPERFGQVGGSALAQKFDQMLNSVPSHVLHAPHHPHAAPLQLPGMLSAVGDASKTFAHDLKVLDSTGSNMNLKELAVVNHKLMLDAAMVQATTTLTSSVMQSSKNAVQTLIKNQ